MRRIAKFHKVSREQFAEGWKDTFGQVTEAETEAVYDSIKLPKRATAGSAGYDFYSPLSFELKPGETIPCLLKGYHIIPKCDQPHVCLTWG